MHALSTALLLASLGAGTLAASYHGLFFTSSDSSCLLIGAPILPNDGTKGQFSSSVAAIKPQLVDCTLYVRKEGPNGIEEDPVLVINPGDRQCRKLPDGKLHWNTVCADEEGDDKDDDEEDK